MKYGRKRGKSGRGEERVRRPVFDFKFAQAGYHAGAKLEVDGESDLLRGYVREDAVEGGRSTKSDHPMSKHPSESGATEVFESK